MIRPILDGTLVAESARTKMARFHAPVVEEVQAAIAAHDVVVVGMGWNPHVGTARKVLAQAGLTHHYIGIGNYAVKWKQRLAIKLWSGWPTFPQVFVRGVLVGGASDVEAGLEDGTVKRLLDRTRVSED